MLFGGIYSRPDPARVLGLQESGVASAWNVPLMKRTEKGASDAEEAAVAGGATSSALSVVRGKRRESGDAPSDAP